MVSDEDIERCAADWLARLDRPDVPAAAHADFEAWCRADAERLTAYLRLLAVWNRLDGVKPARAPVVLSFGRTPTS
jgi:ferric-dicitrate binding protein FerR (iron transport regulator)